MRTCIVMGAAVACAMLAVPTSAQGPDPTELVRHVTALDDPALVGLVREALEHHPEVLAAEAGVSVSEALQEAAARPLFNPEVGLDFESAATDDRVLAVSQTLDVAGKGRARTAVAQSEHRLAERALLVARQALAVELLSTLADHWTARELNALDVFRAELMQRFADAARQRYRAGDLNQVDLNVAGLAYSQARIELASTAAELAASEQMLQALAPSASSTDWPMLPASSPVIVLSRDDVDSLVNAVPIVEFRSERVAAAEAAVTLRDRERRADPTLSVYGGEEENESLIGLSFSMPLNVRNRYQHEVAAAEAQRVRAQRELDNASLRARARLEAATERYTLIHEAWEQWRETGAPNLTEQTELLDRLWRAGELGVTEYLVQLDQTLDTQVSVLELRRRLWLAWFEWLAAAGQVGSWLGLPIEARNL